jgi:hypothetical protein
LKRVGVSVVLSILFGMEVSLVAAVSLEALEERFENMLQASRSGEGDELPVKLPMKLGGAKEVRSLPDDRLKFDDEGNDFEAQAAFHIESFRSSTSFQEVNARAGLWRFFCSFPQADGAEESESEAEGGNGAAEVSTETSSTQQVPDVSNGQTGQNGAPKVGAAAAGTRSKRSRRRRS